MSIFSKVTLKTLVKNKVRTIVTVIGIILSAAMVTAVTVSAASIMAYLQDVMASQRGLWHGAFYNMPASDLERLEADPKVDSAATAQVMGWADVSGGEAGGSVYLQVLGGDETFFERMPISLVEGRLPRTPGEIVVRDTWYGTSELEPGDTVTLELGDRYIDGELMDNFNWWVDGEELRIRDTRTYTVVGLCSSPQFEVSSLPGAVAFTCWDEDADVPYLESYFLLKNPADTYDFQREFPGGAYTSDDNSDYLMTLGVSRYSTYYTVMYGFAAILIGLIMFGSVSLIYNAFSISVAERTRQFGLLRSVGATKKQLRSMVFTEALTVSAIGIPLGILSGILGMAVTFHFIGQALGDLFYSFVSSRETSLFLTLHVTPMSVIAAAGIGLVTVLISAWVPSRRAMRITAIEAIRQSTDVKIRRREVKTSPLTYRLFGLEGAVASKHFKRDRKRYRATIVSLFMSVVLFISASSFCRYMTDSVMAVFDNYDYDTRFNGFYDTWLDEAENEEDGSIPSSRMGEVASALSVAEGVTEWSAYMKLDAETVTLTREDMPEDTWERLFGGSTSAAAGGGEDTYRAGIEVYGVEEQCYRAYLAAQGLDEAEFTGENPKVIVRSTMRSFNYDTERVELYPLLREDRKTIDLAFRDERAYDAFHSAIDYESLTEEEKKNGVEEPDFTVTHTYEIGAFLDELPLGLNDSQSRYGIVVLMPESEARKIDLRRYDWWNICFRTGDQENGLANILAAGKAAGLDLRGDRFDDLYADSARERGIVMVVRVISYGFISLISAIAAVNVFNTVSTNILLRRREFAMLRSVGMTKRGFNRMMNFECLLYGTKSLLYGVPAAFAVTYLIYRTVQSALDTDFYLPWSAVAIAVGSVFLVVFLSMLYSMSGIKRDNPIEAMKNEVI